MLSNMMNVANNGLKGNAQFLFAHISQKETLREHTTHLSEYLILKHFTTWNRSL